MRIRGESGISIVEMMIALFITMIVGGLLTMAVLMVVRVERFTSEDSQSLGELRTATERFLKEVRQARKIYATSTGTRIHFWVDYDRDNQQDDDEQLFWELTTSGGATTLTRTSEADIAVDVPPRTVATRLAAGSPFTYAPPPPGTTVVRIVLTSVTVGSGGPAGRTVRSEVRLRNAVA